MSSIFSRLTVLAILAIVGCKTEPTKEPEAAPAKVAEPAKAEPAKATTPAVVEPSAVEPAVAKLGEPAPDFTLPDLDGHSVSLASFRGKTVVLEWFNPECPFVKLSHTKGSLVDTAARQMKNGVVWLAINSGAPGKQGNDVAKNREAIERFAIKNPVLRDEDGRIGKAYGAKHTPHMFIVDADGKLVYRGGPDNSPDGEKASPQGGTLVNYIDKALAELGASKAVSVADTEAYGCSVKYAN
jgi:peroxiredoxin